MNKLGFIREELSPESALEEYAEIISSIDDDIFLAMEAVGLTDDDEFDEEDIALELEDEDDDDEDDDCDDGECDDDDFDDADEGIRDVFSGINPIAAGKKLGSKMKNKLRRNKLKQNGDPEDKRYANESDLEFEFYENMAGLLEAAKAIMDEDDEIDKRIIDDELDIEDDIEDDDENAIANDLADADLAEEAMFIAALEGEDEPLNATLNDALEAVCYGLDRLF